MKGIHSRAGCPHPAVEKHKLCGIILNSARRGRCKHRPVGLCGIANHNIGNAIACRVWLPDHAERLFQCTFPTYLQPNLSERRTAPRSTTIILYSLLLILLSISKRQGPVQTPHRALPYFNYSSLISNY